MSEPIIDVWGGVHQRFGHIGNASRFVNILGRVSSPSGIHAMGYILNETRLRPVTLGPTAFRLLGAGDFNIEIDRSELTAGANTLELRAHSQDGTETRKTVTIEYSAENAWPLPYEAKWAEAKSLQDIAQAVDGRWELTDAGLHTVEIGYDRLVAIGETTWRDLQVTVPITIHRYSDLPAAYGWPSNGTGVGILFGWAGHSDWGDLKPQRGYLPFGAICWHHRRADETNRSLQIFSGADGSIVGEQAGRDLPAGETYIFKAATQSRPYRTSVYLLKVWPAGSPEPDSWDLVAENVPGERNSGSVVLLAHHVEATFGDVRIEPFEEETQT